jgi:hypothetical protein
MAKHYTRGWARTPNGRPRNQAFTVLPYVYSGYYEEFHEKIKENEFEVTVATLDGARVAYASKFPILTRRYLGYDGYKNAGEATVFYGVDADGKPNVRYSIAAGERRGDWRIYLDDRPYDSYYNRREAINALTQAVMDDDLNSRRTPNGYAGRGPSRFTDEPNAWGFTPNHEDAEYLGFYARMKREKFLALAAPLPDWKKNQAVGEHIAGGGKIASPMLYLHIPKGWLEGDFSQPAEVVGHEGRNRVTALPPHTVENVIIIPKYLRARHITPRMIEEIDRRLYTENDDRHAPKRLQYDNLVKDNERTENPRPRNPVFAVVPYIYSGYYEEYPEKIQENKFEVTVATLDGVRVAYESKFPIYLRRNLGYDGYKNAGEATVFYAVGADGKPDMHYSVAAGEGRGDWSIYHDNERFDKFQSRRDALHALAAAVLDND